MFKFMTNIKNILALVTIISLLSNVVLGWVNSNRGNEIDRLNTNLRSTTIQYRDTLGRMVTETTELRFTVADLKAVAKKDSSKLNEIEKQLWEANKEAEKLGIKARRLESYNRADLKVSNDSLITTPVYNKDSSLIALKPIKTKHLEITFDVRPDTILVNHTYRTKIVTIVDRERDMETKRGKRRVFIARLIAPRWQYSAKNVAEDKNAIIEDAVHINFNKK